MYVTQLGLRNFRCFSERDWHIAGQTVLISGNNGTGKTSVAEALYYGCYARSFRTHMPRELICFEQPCAHIIIGFEDGDGQHILHIGMAAHKKVIKLDGQAITGARQLLRRFPVIVTSELDMEVMNGGPAARRSFIDHFLLIYDDTFVGHLHRLNTLVAQRTALLQKVGTLDQEQLKHWTRALWEESKIIAHKRMSVLALLLQHAAQIVQEVVPGAIITAHSVSRVSHENFEDFWSQVMTSGLCAQEQRQRRTLFGAHLDDILFTFNGKPVRLFASRGQQKLILLALKCALAQLLVTELGLNPVLFFDDILLDLDEQKMSRVLQIAQTLQCQVFISCAQQADLVAARCLPNQPQLIVL